MFAEFFASKEFADAMTILQNEFPLAIWETFYVTIVSTAIAILIGLPLGVLLAVGGKDGILPLPRWLLMLLDVLINLLRSVPFLILMIMVIPLTRLIVGTPVGTVASIVPLVIAAIETDRVFVLVTTLDTEAALNLAIAVFHIVGNDTEGGVHIDINVQITVAGIHIDLIEVAGKILDGKRAVAQFVDGDALFQLVDLAISVLQFHIAVVQPVDMDVAVFGFSVHLPDISETEVGVLAVDIQLRAVADRGFAAIGQVQSGVVDIGDIHIAILHVDAERSREITAIEIAVFDMQIAFSLIVFRHDDIAVLLCQVARQFRRHIDIVVDGEGFVRASIPVLRPQACNGRNRIAHLFHPYVDTVDDSLRLFVITGFRLDHDTDGDSCSNA